MAPALRDKGGISISSTSVPSGARQRGGTHKTPMLMAMATPIFSFLRIWSPQISFHGIMASVTSMRPE